MDPLKARVDTNDSSRIIFSHALTLEEARRYLWKRPPPVDALRPDPKEFAVHGRQRQYLIKKDLDVVLSLDHGLANEYVKRIKPISSTAPAELPKWVPETVRQTILRGNLPNGVTRFPGVKPWGDIVAWINRNGGYTEIQVYEEYPEDINYYLEITRQDGRQARLLQQVYTGFNNDMTYFLDKGFSPDMARSEIRRINDEVFKLVLEGAVSMLSAGAGISAVGASIRSSANGVIETAERTSFASTKAPEAIKEIRLSQEEYRTALSRVFPAHHLDPLARTVDDIGQRAAERLADDPNFLRALLKRDWKTAGNMFHDAAKREARALTPGSLPPGWQLTAEETIQSGKGGSRLDLFLRGPAGERIEFDWKTSGMSALSSDARKEMAKHAGQIVVKTGGKVISQESRSWVDYVRAYFPSVKW
jgi:hypothetical protein